VGAPLYNPPKTKNKETKNKNKRLLREKTSLRGASPLITPK